MGTRDLTRGLPRDAAEQVCAYLSTLDDALPLPRAERARILAEAADALGCEIEAGIAAGKTARATAHEAVKAFGAPDMLAAQFAEAMAPGMARRTGAALMVTGPLVGLAWVTAVGEGHGWARISSVLTMVPYLPLVLAATVVCAMVAVMAGRPPARSVWGIRWAAGAAWVAAIGCVAADAILLTIGMQQIHLGVAGAGAAALSLLRLAGAATAGYRLSRLRAAAR